MPGLDGLRAVAVVMVMLDHASDTRGAEGLFHRVGDMGAGSLGVRIFFVISGFIITHLLLREETAGGVRLTAFWLRRSLRILPPLYVYLLAIVVLHHVWPEVDPPLETVGSAATFTTMLTSTQISWWVGHTWTLAVEEQFYLLWPLLFVGAPRWRPMVLGLLAVLVPMSVIFTWGWNPVRAPWLLPAHAGYLWAGCTLAIWRGSSLGPGPTENLPVFPVALVGTMLAVGVHVAKMWVIFPSFVLPFGSLVGGIGVAMCIDLIIGERMPRVARWLEWPGMVWLGSLSYSIYLWQQLFLCPDGIRLVQTFPFAVGFSVMAGWLSQRFVERPFSALKERFSKAS